MQPDTAASLARPQRHFPVPVIDADRPRLETAKMRFRIQAEALHITFIVVHQKGLRIQSREQNPEVSGSAIAG